MIPRFHATKGYTNDPNGLVFFKGLYHVFFQSADGRMNNLEQPVCWGHAVSRDLVQWQQVENALLPDQPYEKDQGCWSGSAVVKDDKLYLFYTGAARPCASVNVAWSKDGIHFEKYAENPVIPRGPEDADSWEFCDPKVQKIGDVYHMVVGNSANGIGRVVRYTSTDLLHWEYAGVLYENRELGTMLECPDFFPLEDRYVLMVSLYSRRAVMIVGTFDGEHFYAERICQPEQGCSFYAPQSFQTPDGRRLMLGWAFEAEPRPGSTYVGGMTVMRQLRLEGNQICSEPVRELTPLLKAADPCVQITENGVQLFRPDGRPFGYSSAFLHTPAVAFAGERPLRYDGPVENVRILRDEDWLEVFINNGTCNFTVYTSR